MIDEIRDFLIDLGTSAGTKLLYALLILIVGLKLSKWIAGRLSNLHAFKNMDRSASRFICNILKIALNATVIIAAAITIGVPATSFITILGSAGLAVGLALQGSLSNLAGSLMIMMFKPYKLGDYIKVDSIEGTVADINIFYTVIDTLDNKRISCPNGTLSNSNIINFSAKDIRRVDITYSVDYSSDVENVKKTLLDTAAALPKTLTDPAPEARMIAQSDSSLDFALRVWCKTEDYWDVYFGMNEGVKKAFDERGIEIPFPQMDIHIKQPSD